MTEVEWHTNEFSGRMLEYSKRISALTFAARCRKHRLAAAAIVHTFLQSGTQEKSIEDKVFSLLLSGENWCESGGSTDSLKEAVLAAELPMGREAKPNWNSVLLSLFNREPFTAVREVCADTESGRLGSKVAFVVIHCAILRDIFGNPFRPVAFASEWRTSTALAIAQGMYESRDFSAMAILADALQDAGCVNDDILNHCRDPHQVHVRGCWVVDSVLGKS